MALPTQEGWCVATLDKKGAKPVSECVGFDLACQTANLLNNKRDAAIGRDAVILACTIDTEWIPPMWLSIDKHGVKVLMDDPVEEEV
jgi:hypothetical protein